MNHNLITQYLTFVSLNVARNSQESMVARASASIKNQEDDNKAMLQDNFMGKILHINFEEQKIIKTKQTKEIAFWKDI
jgi:hypothetical protein